MLLLSEESLFIVCNTTNDTIAADGGNVSIPDHGKPCVFPFMYEGKEFFKCTTYIYSACSSCIWCGTQFNVTDDSGWGMCGERCAKEGEYVRLRFEH